jgi:hypothetical protein
MFIAHAKRSFTKSGEQRAQGTFLMLMSLDPYNPETPKHLKNEIRSLVLPSVRMRQCGHFMMSSFLFTQFEPHIRVPLSGSYGGDGLPRTVPLPIFELGAKLPDELRKAWNEGGGWNSAGSEANAMQKWAIENSPRVTQKGYPTRKLIKT